MELKITNEEQNPLFNRKKIKGTLISKSAPKRHEVIKYLSEKYSVPVDAVRVLNIRGGFGTKEFTIKANIYSSPEERNKYEKLTKRETESEKKLSEKPEEKPAETPTQEKPTEPKGIADETSAEEKKEETKEEKEVPEKSEPKPVVEVKPEPAPEPKGIIDETSAKEDKKEKDKSKEEKLNEKELQA